MNLFNGTKIYPKKATPSDKYKEEDKKTDVLILYAFVFYWRKYTSFLESDSVICVQMQPGCSFGFKIKRLGKIRLGTERQGRE